ncbi:MAG: 2,3-bisphosphoglycerate-independent phosphoglycerate mutase [Syntrophales bacterium]|nr:2,3-bisphosphoglycerate-independent phosphoglycerate mutase [Syntrophales bacterium]
MSDPEFIDRLVVSNTTKIVFLVLDGLGGIPREEDGLTELEKARTPHLDELASRSVCGLLDPIGCGITPGSGPAHFALFGYDPEKNTIGRGVLEGAGIDFPMTERDLLIRVNFATIDEKGIVVDRRAGRIDTLTNVRLCRKLKDNVKLENIEVFFEAVKDHRALLVLRGEHLDEGIRETDPQRTGFPPLQPEALRPEAEWTSRVLRELIEQSKSVLAGETANFILLRGYARYRRYPSLRERFGLHPLAIASYPMYRGLARLLGMDVAEKVDSISGEFELLEKHFPEYDFFYVHIKETDSRGEDGDFEAKVKVIEEIDRYIPLLMELNPDVLVVTGDHSTPAVLASHSWHPVPVLLYSRTCRPDAVKCFSERACISGGLGRMPMVNLMGLALAHALRLDKFGA